MTTTSAEPPVAQTEPTGAVAGLAQRLLTLPPAPGLPGELYAKTVQGHVDLERTSFTLAPHSALSTNTYSGRVPASYWQRWTAVREMTFEAQTSGEGRVEILASDPTGEERVLTGAALSGSGAVSLTVTLDRFVDGGAVWAEFSSADAPLTVSSGRWTIPHPPRPRKTAVVICTHNRPADCVKTLQTLAADLPALDELDTVYVVDQGDKRVSAHPDFEQVSAALAGRLRYITQANLGGAGGFTRGMYEITEVESAHPANVLFMDDDIVLEPESIIRMTAFANSAREPVIVGAQMLYALHPKRLHHRHPPRGRRLARRLHREGPGRLVAVLQHPQQPDHLGPAHGLRQPGHRGHAVRAAGGLHRRAAVRAGRDRRQGHRRLPRRPGDPGRRRAAGPR